MDTYSKMLQDINNALEGHTKLAAHGDVHGGQGAIKADSRTYESPGSIVPEEKKKDEAEAGKSMYPTDNEPGKKSTEALNPGESEGVKELASKTEIKSASVLQNLYHDLYGTKTASDDEDDQGSASNVDSNEDEGADKPMTDASLEAIGLEPEDITSISDEEAESTMDEEEKEAMKGCSSYNKKMAFLQKKAQLAFMRKNSDFIMKEAFLALQPTIQEITEFEKGRMYRGLEKAGCLIDPESAQAEFDVAADYAVAGTIEKLASAGAIVIPTEEMEKQASFEKQAAQSYFLKEAAYRATNEMLRDLQGVATSKQINKALGANPK